MKEIGYVECLLSEVKKIKKGQTIGYGNTYKSKKDIIIGVIPIGHYDGFEIRNKRDNYCLKENLKSVGIEIKKIIKPEKKYVSINDKKYNIIGRIGLNYSVINLNENSQIKNLDKVKINEKPLNINSQIRREYI